MGQHKFNPVARAAKEGKTPPKPPREGSAAVRRRIQRQIEKDTGLDRIMEGIKGQLPEGHPMLQPPRKVKTWEELVGLVSWDGRYRIEVDLEGGNGKIVPTFEVENKDYWDHYEYLSTQTFYEKTHKIYTNILQSFGFNVELVSWG